MKFNEAQLQAIRHFRGPALILAGPGSGKTAVITQRTKQLITEYQVDPGNILVITFTKAAASEMERRFHALMEDGTSGTDMTRLRAAQETVNPRSDARAAQETADPRFDALAAQETVNPRSDARAAQENGKLRPGTRSRVTFGTFHAVFFMVLKLAYHMSADNIVRPEQQYQLMRELIAKHDIDYRDEKEMIQGLLSEVGRVKNSRLNIDEYDSDQCDPKEFRAIFGEYDKRLRGSRLIDFDDMLTYTWELFDQRKDILSAWQKKYKYILIDEFQDINPIQYEIIRMMAEPENNLFIVGDDDQSIYRFRGSEPKIMLGFQEDYPEAVQILLDTNYRCDAYVVEDSLKLIGHNQTRFQKEIKAGCPGKNKVVYRQFKEQKQENAYLLERLLEGRKEGFGWGDFAVLFRTNTQPRALMEVLMGHNIPFRIRDHVPNLYEHWIARDIFTYIRIAQGSRDRADFLQIMNRPLRYISRDSLTEAEVSFEAWKKYYSEQEWIADRIDRMEYDARIMEGMSPFAAVNYIRHAIDYDSYLEQYAERRHVNVQELEDVLEELHRTAKGFKSYDDWFRHIHEYSDNLKKMAAQRMAGADVVTMATLHSSKGLEFRRVFIIDANEGIMPYKKAVFQEDLEEERRMFYVGMTRAKERLEIYSSGDVGDGEASRFVDEASGSLGTM